MLNAEIERAETPFRAKGGELNALRERLLDLMWDEVGIIRERAVMQDALTALTDLENELLSSGVADDDRAFNLTWSDWLNLRSQIEMVESHHASGAAAGELARRAFPQRFSRSRRPGDLPLHRRASGEWPAERFRRSGQFTIVKPGETLLRDQEAAE